MMLQKTRDYFKDLVAVLNINKKLFLIMTLRIPILLFYLVGADVLATKIDSYFLRQPLNNTTISNGTLKFTLRDVESFVILRENTEKMFNRYLTPKKGDVFLDVGAHIGKYTIKIAKIVGSKGKVIAIEADPNNFDLLKRNVEINKLENVTLFNIAAWNSACKLTFYKGDSSGHGTVKGNRQFGKFVLDARPIDALLKGEKVDWVKIDVEGAEYEVLKGAIQTIKISRPKLIVEVFPQNRETVFGFMKELDYRWDVISEYNYFFYN
ncbi:MAG: FkbM family methyltransferase [Candidatus Verstraetearchaeota archaeon]|nr:FkbM family methyltransferase [Candidatus Verstraetearchaeota archaeon]